MSFAGFLIKCLRVYWHSLPQCRFAWPFSRRVGFSSRCFFLCRSFRFFVCRAFAVRHGYPSPVFYLFCYVIFCFISFLISAPHWWWLSGILSHLWFFFYSLALLAQFQYDVLYKFL
jgi:hypothetical protein